MNDGLKDKHRRAVLEILAAHPGVEKVILFGSRAMGTHTVTSDVDIVIFGDRLTLADQARLAGEIDELPIPQRVDLLRYKTIKDKKLLAHIRKHGHVLEPGRYVRAEDVEDDGEPIQDTIRRPTTTLNEQFAESTKLEQVIRGNVQRVTDPLAMDPNVYKSQVQKEFQRLFDAAETKNQLYFLMTIFGGWPALNWSTLFVAHVNEITTRLILNRARVGSASAIPPHEILFALQINLEAKAVYAVIRNLVFVAAGKHARPEPWDQRRGEYRADKSGHVTISTRRILSNLVQDFGGAGFTFLADELEATHITNVGHIRNAIAHSTFRFPGAETNDKWVFASYAESTPGFIKIEPHEYTNDEFQEICRRFFAYRLAFAAAFDECRATFGERSFTFQAENQMKPGELLDCTFDRGSVAVKYKGTPLW